MPNAAIVLNLLFFTSIFASYAINFWVIRQINKAGLWPTESFFGFKNVRRFRLYLTDIKLLRQLIENTEDAAEVQRYRRWLNAVFLSFGLGFFALAVLLAFVPWLYSQVP